MIGPLRRRGEIEKPRQPPPFDATESDDGHDIIRAANHDRHQGDQRIRDLPPPIGQFRKVILNERRGYLRRGQASLHALSYNLRSQ